MRIKNAFTLGETLIVITIIGILATITMTALTGSMPDKKKAMFKKGYSVVERTVGEMVNDETLYPFNREKIGFKNDESIEIPGTGETASGAQKFCKIFSNKLNTVGAPEKPCEFETTDGVKWSIPEENFPAKNQIVITMDINGKKGPDEYGDDKYKVTVHSDGKVSVESGSVEADMLSSQTIKKEERKTETPK